jgi:hypothetical protein
MRASCLPRQAHKLTLAYVAASAADQQTLLSFLPAPHADGTPIQLSEIPTSLPAYLIHVTAELRVDGVAVASGGDFTLGQDLVGQGGFTTMDLSDWDLTTDLHLAGQGGGLGLSLEGVSKAQLAAVQSRLQTTSAQVAANNPANLSGEQLAGDVLYATALQYLATLEGFGQGVQRQANVVDLPGLSYGFFYAAVAPIKVYGVIVMNATEILDTGGGACALDLSERYMEFWFPLTALAALPIGKGIQGLVLKLMGAMYGGDLFKGVGNSAECHP